MAPPRIGVIGARRNSQGIGEYVARDLASLGSKVTAIVGTTPETVDTARRNLSERYGLSVRGYCSVDAMLASEELDAVAICSPHQFHRAHLHAALRRSLHTLCEKPLLFEEGRDLVRDAQELVAGFAASRRVLMVNEQWPYTLPFFDQCWPHFRRKSDPPDRLSVLLCPSEKGEAMIPNALPHVLSLLLTLAPGGGQAEGIRIRAWGDDTLDLQFRYVHNLGETHVSSRFRQYPHQPRPAGYALNGFGVRRVIELPSYTMAFERCQFSQDDEFWRFVEYGNAGNAAEPQVPIADPLPRLLADFLHRIEFTGEDDCVHPTMVNNTRLLTEIVAAARHAAV